MRISDWSSDVCSSDLPDAKPDFNHWNVAYETYAHGHGRFFGKKTPMKGDVRAASGIAHASTADMIEAMAARLTLLAVGLDAQVPAEDVEVVRSLQGMPIPGGDGQRVVSGQGVSLSCDTECHRT